MLHVLRDLLLGLVVGAGASIGVAIYLAADAAILRLRHRRKTGSPTPRRFFLNQTIAPEESAPSLADVVHAATGAKHLFVRTHCRAPNSIRISRAADALIREELARHVVDGLDRERCLDPAEPMSFQGVPTEVDDALTGAEVVCV